MTKKYGSRDLVDEVGRYRALLNDGPRVYCDFAECEARTADGFCEFCGRTNHPASQDEDIYDPPSRSPWMREHAGSGGAE
jgi:hypothetical protein